MPLEKQTNVTVRFEITEFTVNTLKQKISVAANVTVKEGEAVISTSQKTFSLTGAEYAAAGGGAPVGATVYDVIKTALYDALQVSL
jgi:hypothetical protein